MLDYAVPKDASEWRWLTPFAMAGFGIGILLYLISSLFLESMLCAVGMTFPAAKHWSRIIPSIAAALFFAAGTVLAGSANTRKSSRDVWAIVALVLNGIALAALGFDYFAHGSR